MSTAGPRHRAFARREERAAICLRLIFQFWQQGDEREGQHRADAWHRSEQLVGLSESSIGGDHLGQALVEEADIGLQSDQAAFAEPPEHGIFEMGGLVLDGDMLVTQLSPHGDDLGEPFDRVVPLHNSCRHDGDVLRDQSCIEAIVLGQHAAGRANCRSLFGLIRRMTRRPRAGPGWYRARNHRSARGRLRDRERAQPCDQFSPTGGIVAHRRASPRAAPRRPAILRHVEAPIGEHCHLRIPFLLMRARARATVRVWRSDGAPSSFAD